LEAPESRCPTKVTTNGECYIGLARNGKRTEASMSPTLLIVAGPNGAGKTTFAQKFLPYYADCKSFINADLIAAGISPLSPDLVAVKAGRIMLQEIEAIDAGP
jgi:hypothetical protein